jgi:hypothetical protein
VRFYVKAIARINLSGNTYLFIKGFDSKNKGIEKDFVKAVLLCKK